MTEIKPFELMLPCSISLHEVDEDGDVSYEKYYALCGRLLGLPSPSNNQEFIEEDSLQEILSFLFGGDVMLVTTGSSDDPAQQGHFLLFKCEEHKVEFMLRFM